MLVSIFVGKFSPSNIDENVLIDEKVLICSQPMKDKLYNYFEENVSLSLIGLNDPVLITNIENLFSWKTRLR